MARKVHRHCAAPQARYLIGKIILRVCHRLSTPQTVSPNARPSRIRARANDLTQVVGQGVDVEVVRVHDGGFGEVLRRRVLLSDAAVEDDDFFVAPDISALS